MRTVLLILLAVLSLPVAAVEVEGIHKEHRPITVKHNADDVIAVLFWRDGMAMQLGEDHFDREVEGRTVFVAPPGNYIVTIRGSQVIVVTPDNDSIGPEPNPGPIPGPQPPGPNPPGPDPAPGPNPPILAKHLVFLEERQDRALNEKKTAVITSVSLKAQMADRGIRITTYDDDELEAAPFAKLTQDRPAMFLMNKDGKEFRIFPVPETIEGVEKIVRENTIR